MDLEWSDSHVGQTRNRAWAIIGVQRAQNQVAGECRLHGDFSRFQIANLTDHDDIGVLSQDRPQGSRESHLGRGVHMNLIDQVQTILDRVFHGEDTTELNTTILIPDGQGVIIGGLIQETDIERQTKVPVLGDIWLLGRLFQRRSVIRERTEVVVALLPRIVGCELSPSAIEADNLGRADLPLLTPELEPAPRPEPSLSDAIRKPIWPPRTWWR